MNGERPLRVFLVVGEESGDQLGSRLMEALIRRTGGAVRFSGVGGARMEALGLSSLFPLHDIAVMGITAVLGRLPTILRRIRQTAEAAVADDPDVLVIIDSPDFTHRVAKAVRKRHPEIPVVDYVSPSVWAWRPGRARRMAAYVDHLLALLPFEPEIHRRLGGPPTTYVGHPLTDRPELLRPAPGERVPIAEATPPRLLVLPGSRGGEIDRMLGVFGETVGRLKAEGHAFDLTIPAVSRLADRIAAETAGWAVRPEVVTGEAAKFAAFRSAHAALATSGTVTLELALAGVPMVVAYRRDPLFRLITDVVRLVPGQVQVSSMVLANIVLGERIVPDHLDPHVDAVTLARDLAPLLADSPQRRAQVDGLARLWTAMAPPAGRPAAEIAADVVLDAAISGAEVPAR
jgi:lipid-A-disaccharide synthase